VIDVMKARPIGRRLVQVERRGKVERVGRTGGPQSRAHHARMAEVDSGELERLGSALRLAQSALEEALEAAENLGNFDRRFDVPRAVGGAQRLVGNALEAVDAARKP
jgi:hypothetical protein